MRIAFAFEANIKCNWKIKETESYCLIIKLDVPESKFYWHGIYKTKEMKCFMMYGSG